MYQPKSDWEQLTLTASGVAAAAGVVVVLLFVANLVLFVAGF